ncbi:MAG TPA: CvpA family protein [Candidatus Nitrosopolaris sp.]|nr:CvpA family protein [Candidatus Nitrosopolaris sp.]
MFLNQVDALLVVLLVAFALRGYWRGFCREGFGLAGLVGGVLLAAAAGPSLTDALVKRHLLPLLAAAPASYTGLFLGTVVLARLLGALADRLIRALPLGSVNRAAGAMVGVLRGGTLLGFGLLTILRFAPTSSASEVVAASTLGRPLTRLAEGVIETGRELLGHPPIGEQHV